MMTCRIQVITAEARGLMDSVSSASFISERLAQTHHLQRSSRSATISGIAGLLHKSRVQSVVKFAISAVVPKIETEAVVVPQLTCDLLQYPITFSMTWRHLSDISLAGPHFNHPGKIDVLLGVDVFAKVSRGGRQTGPPGSPVAFETELCWVLGGEVNSSSVHGNHIASQHVIVMILFTSFGRWSSNLLAN